MPRTRLPSRSCPERRPACPGRGAGSPGPPALMQPPVLPCISSRVSCSAWEGVWRGSVLIPRLTGPFRVSSRHPLRLLLKEGISGSVSSPETLSLVSRARNPGQAGNGATPCTVSLGTVLRVPSLLVLLSGGSAGVRATRDPVRHTHLLSRYGLSRDIEAPCVLQWDLAVCPSWM